MTEEAKPKKTMKFSCSSPKCDFSGTSPYAVKQHYGQYPSHSPQHAAKKVKSRRPRQTAVSPDLANLSLQQLQSELNARQEKLAAIDAQKQQLITEILDCDKQLASTNGAAKAKATKAPKATAGKPGRKPKKGLTMPKVLVKVLKNRKKGMKVSDLPAAVLKAGYKTKSANLYPMINQALRDQELFVKLARGVYTTK